MDSTTLITLLGTIAATLGGKEAWTYYKKRLEIKSKILISGSSSEVALRDEIKKLLGNQISELKEQVKSLTNRINHLEQERDSDKKRIANQEIHINVLTERLASKMGSTGKKRRLDDIDGIGGI